VMHFSSKRGLAIACRLSVPLFVCIIGVLWSHKLEFFRNNFTISLSRMFTLCRPKHQRSTPRGTPRNFGPKWPVPLLIWAPETFYHKLRLNGYR